MSTTVDSRSGFRTCESNVQLRNAPDKQGNGAEPPSGKGRARSASDHRAASCRASSAEAPGAGREATPNEPCSGVDRVVVLLTTARLWFCPSLMTPPRVRERQQRSHPASPRAMLRAAVPQYQNRKPERPQGNSDVAKSTTIRDSAAIAMAAAGPRLDATVSSDGNNRTPRVVHGENGLLIDL